MPHHVAWHFSFSDAKKMTNTVHTENVRYRYFIFFSYDGTNYHGWQIQPNALSVQQRLNEALTLLLRQDVETTGAGRTDTGVHAAFMTAHFDCNTLTDPAWLLDKLNRLLPKDIAVHDIRQVRQDAHARFDAQERTYHYHVYSKKNPFRRHYAVRLHYTPDYEAMNEAAKLLLEAEDFTSFSKLHTDTKTNICHVKKAQWVQVENDLWRFEITADRFLRNMVRAIVGTLLEVGRHRMSQEEFLKVINNKNRCTAGDSAPGNALSLVNVTYPEEIFHI